MLKDELKNPKALLMTPATNCTSQFYPGPKQMQIHSGAKITGITLHDRFVVGKAVNKQKTIFECSDLTDVTQKLIIKISNNIDEMDNEVNILQSLQKREENDKFQYPYDYTPLVIQNGQFSFSQNSFNSIGKLCSYYIIKQYGFSLNTVLQAFDQKLSIKTIMQIGIKILEIIEKIHSAGYSYNNLSLKNIIVGNSHHELSKCREIRVVDFKKCVKLNENKNSIKDDLIQVHQILAVLLSNGQSQEPQLIPTQINSDKNNKVNLIKDFINQVENIETGQNPSYEKLRFILMMNISQELQSFDQVYDWNKLQSSDLQNTNLDRILKLKNLNSTAPEIVNKSILPSSLNKQEIRNHVQKDQSKQLVKITKQLTMGVKISRELILGENGTMQQYCQKQTISEQEEKFYNDLNDSQNSTHEVLSSMSSDSDLNGETSLKMNSENIRVIQKMKDEYLKAIGIKQASSNSLQEEEKKGESKLVKREWCEYLQQSDENNLSFASIDSSDSSDFDLAKGSGQVRNVQNFFQSKAGKKGGKYSKINRNSMKNLNELVQESEGSDQDEFNCEDTPETDLSFQINSLANAQTKYKKSLK